MHSEIYSVAQKEVLSNGITFIHNCNIEQPVVSTIIFLKMGSIYEPQELAGISDLLQATIIKGTKNRSSQQIAEEVEILGGTISADSSDDYSTLSISVGKQHFEKSIEILSDIFYNPIFPEGEIEKEKMNIIAGILSRKDKIFNIAIDELLLNLYGKQHPYGRKPESIIKSLKRIKRNELLLWWEKFYGLDITNNNIIIVTSGDIDFQYAKDIISKYFKSFRSIKLPIIKNINVKLSKKHIKKKLHFKQGYLMYGYISPPLNKLEQYLSIKILSSYLGGGMSSKLFEFLREKQSLCYETNCFYPTRYLDSYFVVYLGFDYTKVDTAKREIENIIQQVLRGELLNEEELKETKSKIKGRFLLDHQTSLRQAWYLGFWEIMGLGYDYDFKYLSDIEKIKLEQVRENIKKIFSSPYVIVEIIPKKKY